MLYTEGDRARSSSPRQNWLLIWTGTHGDRYFVDTSTVERDGAVRGQAALTAFYVPPLTLYRRVGISALIREDALAFDCARETLNGGATWRRYDVTALRGRTSAPDSIFADSGERTGPRHAALEYACRTFWKRTTAPTAGATR